MLWINNNTQKDFSLQTTTLDLSSYKFVYIALVYLTTDGVGGYLLIPVGEEVTFSTAYYSYQHVVLRRFIVNSDIIWIGEGLKTGITDNSVVVPVRIYGIK